MSYLELAKKALTDRDRDMPLDVAATSTQYEIDEIDELRLLPEGETLAAELDRLCRLATRLRSGEITAVRCGLTGKRCTACAGVPCFGSQPWDGD